MQDTDNVTERTPCLPHCYSGELFQATNHAVCVIEILVDESGRATDYLFLQVNPAFGTHTGLRGAVHRRIRELLPNIEQEWIDIYGQVARSGLSTRLKRRCEALDRFFEVHAFRVGPAAERHVGIVFSDISERNRSEELLRQSETRFRAIVGQVSVGIVYGDSQGLMTFVNSRWSEMVGYDEHELLGKNVADLTHPDSLEPTLTALHALASGGPPFVIEKRYVRKNGTAFWANSSVNAIRDSTGAFLGFVAVVLDISERWAIQENLRVAKVQAEQAAQAKDHFLASLSHELRTPLNPVLMTARALREDESLAPEIREQMAMIERNVALEVLLIDDLLDLTRITRGKLTLRVHDCDLHSLVARVVEMVGEDAREKKIGIGLELTAQHSSLQGDSARLQQVVWNLLRNAVKFTPFGGQIAIRSFDRSTTAGWSFVLEVADTGVGIDPAKISDIFEPFEQASPDEQYRANGLGLGLAIARGVVDLHRGKIRAHSEGFDRGSTFTVELPGATLASLEPRTESGKAEGTGEAAMSLLVVEDHVATLQVLVRLLTRAGHTIVGVGTIADAKRAAASIRFDGVISDLGLPDGTGLELMTELQSSHNLRGIMLSGYGMERDIQHSRDAGFVAHLVKPIDVHELRRSLHLLTTQS